MKLTSTQVQYEETLTTDDDRADVFGSLYDWDGQNGLVTANLDWAGIHLFEDLGIESIVGIAGFESSGHFKQWAESLTKVDLNEWDSIELVLYACWMPCIYDQFPEFHELTLGADESNCYEEQFCYLVWRENPDPDAIKSTRNHVYALRHKAYTFKSEKGVEFLHDARQRSYNKLAISLLRAAAL